MALTNKEIIGRGLDFLVKGLKPFVKRELTRHGEMVRLNDDPYMLLKTMAEHWQGVFGKVLGEREKHYVHELRTFRNMAAHGEQLTGTDVERGLSGMSGLLEAIGEGQLAETLNRERIRFFEERRSELARKRARTAAESAIKTGELPANLKPWREVAVPHDDVKGGRYNEADYAANLWSVYKGGAGAEYGNAEDFFKRTYLTEGLKRLLTDAIERLSGRGGTPVYELMTNFGGGKTHSLLALFHLFGGNSANDLKGVPDLLSEAGIAGLPLDVNRAVVVGTQTLSPGQTSHKDDGTEVRTIWGEIAYQLGGREGYEMVQQADESGTNPGEALTKLFTAYSPCLILLDEWIAYARQLLENPTREDLEKFPGGSFETQLTFVQTLTETAEAVPKALVVVSLPESKTEIGGELGERAHDRMRNVLARIRTAWRPAEREESFEIVKRRMFQDIDENEALAVVRSFRDIYAKSASEYPNYALEPEYEKRMRRCYPIHPEFFDRLYEDWAPLENFQHTRGVLRLMAGVISALWASDQRNLLIMPGFLPLVNERVRTQITSFLSNAWIPVVETDVDGLNPLPAQLDEEFNHLGRYSATKRVARAVFLGSAPSGRASAQGITDKQIVLGCVQPGEQASSFHNALHRLSERASHLYNEGQRYWFDTRVTLNRVAHDYAERLTQGEVQEGIAKKLGEWKTQREPFRAVHPCPASTADVMDSRELRLVVLRPESSHSNRATESPATKDALEILARVGDKDRMYRNCLVFVAADAAKTEAIEVSMRKVLAWQRIIDEAGERHLDLQGSQLASAKKRLSDARADLDAKLKDAYCWALYPVSHTFDQREVEVESFKINTTDSPIGQRVATRLHADELLLARMSSKTLRRCLDNPIKDHTEATLWRGNHVAVRELEEDFARYLYLPKMDIGRVLFDAIEQGLAEVNFLEEGVAVADSYNEELKQYEGLKLPPQLIDRVSVRDRLLVRPAIAFEQVGQEPPVTVQPQAPAGNGAVKREQPPRATYRRYFGSMDLDWHRMDEVIRKVRDEVLLKMADTPGADIQIRMEISAKLPQGIEDHTRMVISENSRTLGINADFEQS